MKRFFFRRRAAFVFLFALGSIFAALYVAPWRTIAESTVKSALISHGAKQADLTLTQMTVSNISVSDFLLHNAVYTLRVGKISAEGVFGKDDAVWAGTWTVNDAVATLRETAFPAVDGSGKIKVLVADGKLVKKIDGHFRSKDGSMRAAFSLILPVFEPKKAVLMIDSLSFPWQDGTVSVKNCRIPFESPHPIDVNLKIVGVSAQKLLGSLVDDRAVATGKLSGEISLSASMQGDIRILKGHFFAEAPGTLAVSPESIPGQGPQMDLMRDVLRDLHYNILSLDSARKGEKGQSLTMKIEGYNPSVQNGRTVKLNVNLSGAVLDVIEQNLMWMIDSRKVLERGKHAHP